MPDNKRLAPPRNPLMLVDLEKENWRRKPETSRPHARWTGKNLQLTLMTIPVGGDVGLEVHETHDQFLRLEQGKGRVQMGPSKDDLNFEQEVSGGTGPFWFRLDIGTTLPISGMSQ